MKNHLFIAAICCAMSASAQFKVLSTGRATFPDGLNATAPANTKVVVEAKNQNGLYLFQKSTSLSNGINFYSRVYNYSAPSNAKCTSILGEAKNLYDGVPHDRPYLIGVKGYALDGRKNYGVMGEIPSGSVGAAIVGAAKSSSLVLTDTITGCYAGLFYGRVYTRGNMYVDGSVITNFVNLYPAPSNAILTENNTNENLQNNQQRGGFTSALQELPLYTYLQQPQVRKNRQALSSPADAMSGETDLETTNLVEDIDIIASQSLQKTHYALSPEDLEAVYPDLVYDLEDGRKAIDYVGLIPILVQAVGELQTEVQQLRGEEAKTRQLQTGITATTSADALRLGQNEPNPWQVATTIPVCLPETVRHANLYLYDLSGKQIKDIPLTKRGTFNIDLTAQGMDAGIYIYSLIADNKVVATKRMILNK